MTRDRNQIFRRAIFVLHHRVADAGFIREMFSGVRKKRGDSLFSLQGFHKGFRRLRKDGLLRAFGDHLIGIACEHGEYFRAVRGREMRSAGANCYLPLAGSAACAKIIEHFRAEGFHQMRASNLSGTRLLYRRLPEFQRAAWRARSTPATPRKSRRRSLRIAGWRKSGVFLQQKSRRPAARRRRQECAHAWRRMWRRPDPAGQRPWQSQSQKMELQPLSVSHSPRRSALAQPEALRRKIVSRRVARNTIASHKYRLQRARRARQAAPTPQVLEARWAGGEVYFR